MFSSDDLEAAVIRSDVRSMTLLEFTVADVRELSTGEE
jgi:hypothetical protein